MASLQAAPAAGGVGTHHSDEGGDLVALATLGLLVPASASHVPGTRFPSSAGMRTPRMAWTPSGGCSEAFSYPLLTRLCLRFWWSPADPAGTLHSLRAGFSEGSRVRQTTAHVT